MAQLEESEILQFVLTWKPGSVSIAVGHPEGKSELLWADSEGEAPKRLIVGRRGEVFEVGDVGVEVSAFRAYEGAELVVEPAAIEAWTSTVDAIRVLRHRQAEDDFRFEVVQANAIVTMLVTGLEAYGQRRFQELAGEGIQPDVSALAAAFPKITAEPNSDASPPGEEGLLFPYTARTGINFQNYGDLKKAYKAAYGLRITKDAGVSSDVVRKLKAAIKQRHRVIHVSPLETIRSAPGKEPLEFVNRDYANETINLFTEFVEALHQATLSLRPADENDADALPEPLA